MEPEASLRSFLDDLDEIGSQLDRMSDDLPDVRSASDNEGISRCIDVMEESMHVATHEMGTTISLNAEYMGFLYRYSPFPARIRRI